MYICIYVLLIHTYYIFSSRSSHPHALLSKVDCANGVGAGALRQLLSAVGTQLDVALVNIGSGGLNDKAGGRGLLSF